MSSTREHKRPMDRATGRGNKARKGEKGDFPVVLHGMVSNPATDYCIHWLPCGTHFFIADKNRFGEEVLPVYFKNTKFPSFVRRLKRWGFMRVPSGPLMGAYYNPDFKRGEPGRAAHVKYNDQAFLSSDAMKADNVRALTALAGAAEEVRSGAAATVLGQRLIARPAVAPEAGLDDNSVARMPINNNNIALANNARGVDLNQVISLLQLSTAQGLQAPVQTQPQVQQGVSGVTTMMNLVQNQNHVASSVGNNVSEVMVDALKTKLLRQLSQNLDGISVSVLINLVNNNCPQGAQGGQSLQLNAPAALLSTNNNKNAAAERLVMQLAQQQQRQMQRQNIYQLLRQMGRGGLSGNTNSQAPPTVQAESVASQTLSELISRNQNESSHKAPYGNSYSC